MQHHQLDSMSYRYVLLCHPHTLSHKGKKALLSPHLTSGISPLMNSKIKKPKTKFVLGYNEQKRIHKNEKAYRRF